MARIDSGYTLVDGTSLYYEIIQENGKDNGFDIFVGKNVKYPLYHQPEPFIPNPDISYEENAKQYCERLSNHSNTPAKDPFVVTEDMYTSLTANIDYLLLLSEV